MMAVVYAQYIARKEERLGVSSNQIRNAFLLPFNHLKFKSNLVYHYIGYADSNLSIADSQEYTKIHTLLIDTKHLMQAAQKHTLVEINRLSRIIEQNIQKLNNY